jgi:hypothetical protein
VIGKITEGKDFYGLIKYVLDRPDAKLIGGNILGQTSQDITKEFRLYNQLNPRVTKPVLHISLSLPPHENLDIFTWNEFVRRYLEKMGVTENKFMIVLHQENEPEGDTAGRKNQSCQHIHIVANRISFNGTCVSDSWDYQRSETAIRALEKEFNLTPVASSYEKKENLSQVHNSATAQRMRTLLDQAAVGQPDILRFIKILEASDLKVHLQFTARVGNIRGIGYELEGEYFTGTQLGQAYTFPGLQKHLRIDYNPRDKEQLQKDQFAQTIRQRNLLDFSLTQEQDEGTIKGQAMNSDKALRRDLTSPLNKMELG